MTREDIIKMAREAGLAHFHDSEGHCTGITDSVLVDADKDQDDDRLVQMLMPFAALVAATEREKVAAWMIARGYATGHGDSVEDLLQELDWQIREQEREACSKVCEGLGVHPALNVFNGGPEWYKHGKDCAAAIRARSEQCG
jgi:hypothetical protein